MSQRGINARLVDLVSQFGMDHGDKVILTRKNAEALLGAVEGLKSQLLDIHSKGGLVVVEQGEYQITVYPCLLYTSPSPRD